MAGTLGVLLHDRLRAMEWISAAASDNSYDVTPKGIKMFQSLGIDVDQTRALRRRFAFACLDWSERRSHLGGAMGAALLKVALQRKWLTQDLDNRALSITAQGRRELLNRLGVRV